MFSGRAAGGGGGDCWWRAARWRREDRAICTRQKRLGACKRQARSQLQSPPPSPAALDDWAYQRGLKLDYTRPGKPTDNGLIESFNGRLRDEFLNLTEFITMHDLRAKLGIWQKDYDHCRPHGSLGHLTPGGFSWM